MSSRQAEMRARLTPAQKEGLNVLLLRDAMDWAWYFALFVFTLAIGRIIAGEHVIELRSLVLGLPIALFTGWAQHRNYGTLTSLGVLIVFFGGLTVGYLSP